MQTTIISTLIFIFVIALLYYARQGVFHYTHSILKHELLNNLFFHPYTKIEYIERDMMVQRKTATKYLEMIVEEGLLDKLKIGKTNYYINTRLVDLFVNHQTYLENRVGPIESIHIGEPV